MLHHPYGVNNVSQEQSRLKPPAGLPRRYGNRHRRPAPLEAGRCYIKYYLAALAKPYGSAGGVCRPVGSPSRL